MSIRSTASCCQPRHESSVPRGARTGRAPGRGGASWAPGEVVMRRVSRGRRRRHGKSARQGGGLRSAPARAPLAASWTSAPEDRWASVGHGDRRPPAQAATPTPERHPAHGGGATLAAAGRPAARRQPASTDARGSQGAIRYARGQWESSPFAAGPTSTPSSRHASSPARPPPSSSRGWSRRSRRSSPTSASAATPPSSTPPSGSTRVRSTPPTSACSPRSWRPPTPPARPPCSAASARRSTTAGSSTRPRSARRRPAGARRCARGSRWASRCLRSRRPGSTFPPGKGSFPSVLCRSAPRRSWPACRRSPSSSRRCPGPAPWTRRRWPSPTSSGSTHVFRANGPAGIAALTFGTATFPRVRKIVGPGSPAVTAAQVLAQRFGTATNMLCGPSESLLIADATADPWRLALDLVNEAEHGTDSAALVVTDSAALAAPWSRRSPPRWPSLPEPRRAYATAVLGDLGGVLLFDTIDAAVAFANEYAAEHCQVATAETEATLRGAPLRGRGAAGPGHADRREQLHDRDPGDAPDRRLRTGQRRGHGAHVPDDDLDRPALGRGAGGAGRPDDRPRGSRGFPGACQRVPGARPGLNPGFDRLG